MPPGCPGGRGCLSPDSPLVRWWGGGWWGACCRVLGRCALVVVLRVGLVPFLFGVGLACVGGLVVICIVDASIFVLCVVIVVVFVWVVLCVCFLGVRWMPWHQGPMKDVVACDKPRGAGWRAVIRGCPNGGTRHSLWGVTRA